MSFDKGTRRARNAREQQLDRSVRRGRAMVTRGSVTEVKGFIDKVYHPGDELPKRKDNSDIAKRRAPKKQKKEENDVEWNDNVLRVTVIIEDTDQDYDELIKDLPIVLEENPALVGLIYGSDGLGGAPCTIKFMMPNIMNTARVYLQSVRNLKPDNDDDSAIASNEKYLDQKSLSITSAIMG